MFLMTFTIAVSGKGGAGKTTVSALIIDYLRRNKLGSILAVDADPNTNLNEALGIEVKRTLGDVREKLMKVGESSSSKEDYFEYLIYGEVIVEGEGFDLLPMGRPEGPGCYCYINHVLRRIVDKLSRNYDYIVMDTEAGLEHLSRRSTRDVNVMLIVTDPSMRGVLTAKRIRDLATELDTRIRRFYVIANRVSGSSLDYIKGEVEEVGLELIGYIPEDQNILTHDLKGLPLIKIPKDSPAVKAIEDIMAKIVMIKTEDSISKILG